MALDPATWIFGGITLSVVTGAITRVISTKDNVKERTCEERRKSCNNLMCEKLDNHTEKLDNQSKLIVQILNKLG